MGALDDLLKVLNADTLAAGYPVVVFYALTVFSANRDIAGGCHEGGVGAIDHVRGAMVHV